MPIPEHLNDREHGKFVEVAGIPVVRVANADGSAISAGGGGGTSMTDDAAFVAGASSVTPVGYLADDASPDAVDEGDVGAARMRRTTRVQYVELVDASGSPLGVAGNELATSGGGGGGGGAVTIADGDDAALGATTDAEAPGDGSVVGLLKRLRTLLGGTLTIGGTVTANLGSIAGVATDAVLQAVRDRLPGALTAGGNLPVALQEASATVAVAGTVIADAGSGPWPVTDNGGSLTVDGAVTVSATGLDIRPLLSGADSVAAVQSGSWSVAVSALPALAAGTNNIGDVDVLSLPSLPAGSNNIGDVDVSSQPARARTSDHVGAADMTDALMSGTTALTPKFAAIAASASGANQVVAAVASKKLRVLQYVLVANAAVNAKWQSAANDKSGLLYFGGQGHGAAPPYCPLGLLETNAGEALNLSLSAAVAVGGHCVYVEV